MPVGARYKQYTKEEEEFLKNNYFLSKEELTIHLNRNWESIRKKLFSLGIDFHTKKSINNRTWSDEEIDFLVENYPYKNAKYISNKLNKTVKDICRK